MPETLVVTPLAVTGASVERASTSGSCSRARSRPAGSVAAKASVRAKSASTFRPEAFIAFTKLRFAPGFNVTITLKGAASAAWLVCSRRWRSILARRPGPAAASSVRPSVATAASSRLASERRHGVGGVGCGSWVFMVAPGVRCILPPGEQRRGQGPRGLGLVTDKPLLVSGLAPRSGRGLAPARTGGAPQFRGRPRNSGGVGEKAVAPRDSGAASTRGLAIGEAPPGPRARDTADALGGNPPDYCGSSNCAARHSSRYFSRT